MPDIRKTPIFDDMDRADESPLSYDGRWHKLTPGSSDGELDLKANNITNNPGPYGTAASYWAADYFRGDMECWSRGGGGHDITEALRMYICVTNPHYETGQDIWSGYRLEYQDPIGTPFWAITRFDNGSGTTLDSNNVSIPDPTNDRYMLFRKQRGVLYGYSSDVFDPTNWTLIVSAADATYEQGYVGLGTAQDDPNPSWSGGVGGGVLYKTQIYRYVSN